MYIDTILWEYRLTWFNLNTFTGLFMWNVMYSTCVVMHTLLLKGVLHVDCNHFDFVSIA